MSRKLDVLLGRAHAAEMLVRDTVAVLGPWQEPSREMLDALRGVEAIRDAAYRDLGEAFAAENPLTPVVGRP